MSNEEVEHQMNTESTFVKKWTSSMKNVVWKLVFFYTLLHVTSLYGYMTFPYSTHKLTFFWMVAVFIYVGIGVTAGAHRYWSHRTYKATLPLQLILASGYYGAGMFKMYDWVKVHRMHHKFTDTDADPHNATRGFFYSHVGWLMQKKHPEYYKRLKEIDMSDIETDPIATFADKYFLITVFLMTVFLPSLVPVLLWNESWYWAIMSQAFMRQLMVVHTASLVNSAAHMFGSKPYNRHIEPRDNNFVQLATLGEGFHNYHHTFPWDYRAGEIAKFDINMTTALINKFAKIGWAYDLKTASDKLIRETCMKRGDTSYEKLWQEVPEPK